MENSRLRNWFLFIVVLSLFVTTGIVSSGAAPTKYKVPSAPTNVSAVGGLESARLNWKAPSNSGGKKITAYKVIFNPGKNVYICQSSATSCLVPIANPNKPSAKPVPVWFNFIVAAINSIGTGAESRVGNVRALIRFRATATIPLSVPNSTPTPTATASTSPSPTPQVSTPPVPGGIRDFDGKYKGVAVVNVTQNENVISFLSSTLNTSNTVLNGDITGSAGIWRIRGVVTDARGVATLTASNLIFGAISFTLTFVTDPITKVVKGSGQGISTVEYPGLGSIKVTFTFNISNGA